MKSFFLRWLLLFTLFFATEAGAQDSAKLYNPKANVSRDVAALLVQARQQNKHLLLQVGGNWCVWCYRLNAFIQTDTSLKRLIDNNYIVYHLNYSPENKNLDFLRTLDFPQRFGFPVLVVLDANGRRIHTQDSALLEKGNGYDYGKVKDFLRNWSPAALDPNFYKE